MKSHRLRQLRELAESHPHYFSHQYYKETYDGNADQTSHEEDHDQEAIVTKERKRQVGVGRKV